MCHVETAKHKSKLRGNAKYMRFWYDKLGVFVNTYRIYLLRLLAALFLPGIWPVFCLRLIRAIYPEGQSFRMTYHQISVIQSNCKCQKMKMTPMTIYRTYRRTSFFRRRWFLKFWTIKLTLITFACKNQYFVVDCSRRVFTSEEVNWPAAYSWITLDSRYMAKISAAAYLQTRLLSDSETSHML